MASKLSAPEIRAATKWLAKRKISPKEISPRKFAKAAKKLNKTFRETLQIIASQQTGGQV